VVVLDEVGSEAEFGEAAPVPGLEGFAARIAENPRLDQPHVGECGFQAFHSVAFPGIQRTPAAGSPRR